MCLGPDGKISEQGTFADLNDAGGYVSLFSLPRADRTYVHNDGDVVVDHYNDHDSIAVPHTKEIDSGLSLSSSETRCSREGEPDSSRRTGDVQIYFYYVKSVGWWVTLVFVVAIVGFVFCVSFPSKCDSS